jgi:hypothetical protein
MSGKQLFDDFFQRTKSLQTPTTISSKAFRRGDTGIGVSAAAPIHAEFSFEQIAREMEYLNGSSRCVFCGNHYVNWKNIGRHQCRYHPLPGVNGPSTQCCGRPLNTLGCTPCDHSPELILPRWPPSHTVFRLPVQLLPVYQVPESNWTRKPDSPYAEVRRTAPFSYTLNLEY